jgi:hypothetical protein
MMGMDDCATKTNNNTGAKSAPVSHLAIDCFDLDDLPVMNLRLNL